MILAPESLEDFGISHLSLSLGKLGLIMNAYDAADNKISLDLYQASLWYTVPHAYHTTGIDLTVTYDINPETATYICGDMDLIGFSKDRLTYHLYPDGTLVRVDDGSPVIISLSTPEGKLTSVKPIVNTDISALVDAIGKAIAVAYPDEAPVLSSEAISQIYNNVSNVYDDAVTNYYNDTSYIDQSQYITNITNVFEQAIADNPVIDLSATDTGVLSAIKAIPGQISGVLKDIFVPNIALYNFYFFDIKGKFGYVDRFYELGNNIFTIIFDADPEIPVIIMDFSLAESDYNYGGRTYALDMTWYQRFKPLVDDIIVSFSWIVFMYWLYKNLPEIISGVVLSRRDYAVVNYMADNLRYSYGERVVIAKEDYENVKKIR